jgi:chaperone modulatory protein CbpM
MLDIGEFLVRAELTSNVVEAWIEAGWLRPRRSEHGAAFSAIDIARAQLIRDLKEDLGVNDEGIPIILDLIDQMHGLRRALRELCQAVGEQPSELKQRILTEVRRRRPILPNSPAADQSS